MTFCGYLGLTPKGCQEKYHLSSYERHEKQIVAEPVKAAKPTHPLIELELSSEFKITVPEHLESPHSLVSRNLQAFNNAKATDKLTLKPRAKSHFDIHVTEATKERALRIMDALIHTFDKRGWAFKISSEPALTMTVTVLDEAIRFHIEEKINRIDHVLSEKELIAQKANRWVWLPKYDFVASGSLSIHIHAGYNLINRHTWSDGKVQRVEMCLNKFCIALIELAEAIKIDRARREEDKRQREIERLKRQELKIARQAELAAREKLETDFAKWNKANSLRQFIDTVEISLKNKICSDEEIAAKQKWLAWAKNYADLIDPLTKGNSTVAEETEGMYLGSW